MTHDTRTHTQRAGAVVMPQAVETEENLLGALLMDGDQILVTIEEKLKPRHFYLIRNEWIYEAMLDLHRAGEPIDWITVAERLRSVENRLDKIGGEMEIDRLVALRGSGFNTRAYAVIVRQKAEDRALWEGHSASADYVLQNPDLTPMQKWQHTMDSLYAARPAEIYADMLLGRDTVYVFDKHIEDESRNPVWFTMPFDALIGAGVTVYKPGDIITVAGGEGSGKSAFVLQFAQYQAEVEEKRVLVVLTEMDKANVLARRKVRNTAGVSYAHLLRPDQLTDAEWAAFHAVDEKIGTWANRVDLWFCGSTSAKEFFSELRAKVEQYHYDIVIVDGWNDLEFDTVKGGTQAGAIHNFMSYMETFAQKHNLLLVGTVQLNDEGRSLGSRAYERKSSLYLSIITDKTENAETLTFDGVTYGTLPGERSIFRKVYVKKNRRGAGGGLARLAFIGPRYLWIDPPPVATYDFGAVNDAAHVGVQHDE